ncbi:PAS domain S-box protein [Desulforhopalus sp. 52FAK]
MPDTPTYKELQQRVALLEKELEQHQRVERINTTLFNISNAIETTASLNELYKTIHLALSSIIDTTNFYIASYNKIDDSVTIPYIVDTVDVNYPPVIEISKTASLTAEVIRTGTPIMITKSEILAQREKSRLITPECTPAEIWLGVPLKHLGEIVGVMAVQSYDNPLCYDQTDMKVMAAVADQVAIAVELKRTEKALMESEVRFHKLLQEIPSVSVQGYNLDGTTHFWNQASERLYGYTEQEAIGTNLLDLIIPLKMKGDVKQAIQEMAETGVPTPASELSLLRKDGSSVTVFSSHAIVASPGREPELFCIDIDLTERKLAEQKLRESEEKFRKLVTTSPYGIQLTNIEGKIIFSNPTHHKIHGYSDGELTGKYIWDLILDDNDRAHTKSYYQHLVREQPAPEIFYSRDKTKDGREIDVQINWDYMYDSSGNLEGIISIISDITEQKLVENAVKESEQKWRNILVNTPQIGISLDQNATITFVNKHFQKLTGWEEQEIVGQNWFDMFIPNNIREEVSKAFLTVMKQKNTTGFSTFDNEILDRYGTPINVSWSNVLTKDIHGDIIDVTCLGVDLTERQRAETALKESEAYMRSIFRAAPTGIGVVQDRVFRQVNDKFCDMLGYSKDELIGNQSLLIYPSVEEFEKVGQEKYEQIKTKGTGTVETVMKRKNGELTNVLMSSTPIEVNNLSAGVTFTALDITAKKQAEKALQDSHKQFLTVLDSIDASIYVADMDTYEILFMNQHMIDSFGQDMTGEICWKAFRGESAPCLHCTNDKLVDTNNVPTGVVVWNDENPKTEKKYINHDRAIEWTDGRLVRLQIATDITDLLSMEEQLRQAQKMESVGRLAGGVAHDFNNMLSVILGHAELAMEDLDREHPIYNDLQQIQQAASRSSDITRQLLAFARKQIVSPKVIDLNETVAGMLNMLLRLIGEDIDLAWLPGKQLWQIKIDPSQIDQILVNLCVNARDAIAGVGKITVETENCMLDEEYCSAHAGFVSGQYVKIDIGDTGSGMDKEIVSHIFDPFFTTKDVNEGTGLGLAMVYGIVKQNNGFINVYSDTEQGTTFSIYLPRYAEKTNTGESEATEESARHGIETILLVEDEPTMLSMTTTMLERLGYTVLVAGTPNEAIRLAGDHSGEIHLVLTDVIMPEMNGRILTERLMIIRPGLKCLFMSGYTVNVISHQGVLDDGVDFIQKPFAKRELATKIRQALGNE